MVRRVLPLLLHLHFWLFAIATARDRTWEEYSNDAGNWHRTMRKTWDEMLEGWQERRCQGCGEHERKSAEKMVKKLTKRAYELETSSKHFEQALDKCTRLRDELKNKATKHTEDAAKRINKLEDKLDVAKADLFGCRSTAEEIERRSSAAQIHAEGFAASTRNAEAAVEKMKKKTEETENDLKTCQTTIGTLEAALRDQESRPASPERVPLCSAPFQDENGTGQSGKMREAVAKMSGQLEQCQQLAVDLGLGMRQREEDMSQRQLELAAAATQSSWRSACAVACVLGSFLALVFFAVQLDMQRTELCNAQDETRQLEEKLAAERADIVGCTAGMLKEPADLFAYHISDEEADEGTRRFLKIQCPGVDHTDISIDIESNGCTVSIDRPASRGVDPVVWKKRFQFRLADGLFEFREDQALLSHGFLQLVFCSATSSQRTFKFPRHFHLAEEESDEMWLVPTGSTEGTMADICEMTKKIKNLLETSSAGSDPAQIIEVIRQSDEVEDPWLDSNFDAHHRGSDQDLADHVQSSSASPTSSSKFGPDAIDEEEQQPLLDQLSIEGKSSFECPSGSSDNSDTSTCGFEKVTFDA